MCLIISNSLDSLAYLQRSELAEPPSKLEMKSAQAVDPLILNWRPGGPRSEGPPPQLVHPGGYVDENPR